MFNTAILFFENASMGIITHGIEKITCRWDSTLNMVKYKSTKSDAENHGVGLASVYRAVAKYHGSVVIEDSEPGKFKIRIVLYSNVQE